MCHQHHPTPNPLQGEGVSKSPAPFPHPLSGRDRTLILLTVLRDIEVLPCSLRDLRPCATSITQGGISEPSTPFPIHCCYSSSSMQALHMHTRV